MLCSCCAVKKYSVSVIIPTTCEASRAELLLRAIESISSQRLEKGGIEILLICNGSHQDPDLLNLLESKPYLKIFKLVEGNVSKARYFGVSNADGEYFCFLDDDDELLPDSLKERVKLLEQNPGCDVLVSNGLTVSKGEEKPLVDSKIASIVNSNICQSFLRQNWFASAAPLFRASTIDSAIFDFSFKYFEWTYLFFRLVSLRKTIIFDDCLVYRRYEDSPLSSSKTVEYQLAYPGFLLQIKTLDLPPGVKRSIHGKYLTALNAQSNFYLREGKLGKAWLSHLTCLVKGGWRYFLYTRFLIFTVRR